MKQIKGLGLGGWKMRLVVVAVMFAMGAAGCVSGARGSFSPQGYSSSYGYSVANPPGGQQLLPSEWRLDNYFNEGGKLRAKNGQEYVVDYQFDLDGNGTSEGQMLLQAYALRFKHLVNAGSIWLRDVPMYPDLRHKDLRVLMQGFVDEMSGTNYELVQLGRENTNVVRSREYSAKVLAEGRATLAGRPAYFASIEVSNSNQQDSAAGTRSRLVELIIVRAPNDELAGEQPKAKDNGGYPVLMVAGYSNMPADFAVGQKDFHDLLGRMQIDGVSGLTLEQQSVPEQAPGGSPVAVPPPAPRGAAPVAPSAAPVAPSAAPPAAPSANPVAVPPPSAPRT